MLYFLFTNSLVYSENILLPGESLTVNQCLTLQGDGVEWDQAVLSINERSVDLYVEKNNQKESIWSTGELFVKWDDTQVTSFDLLPDGCLNLNASKYWKYWNETSHYLIRSKPEFPVKPISGSYLILEQSPTKKVRIALYSPEQELLWASDANSHQASHILHPFSNGFPSDQTIPPGIILSLEGDDRGFDKATLEFDGWSLSLFEHYANTKILIWQSHEQTCGCGCSGRLSLTFGGLLYCWSCHSGSFFQGHAASCLFIDKDPAGKARLAMYTNEHGVYWTSEMDRMYENNMRHHWD